MTKKIISLLKWVKSKTYNTYCEEMMRDYPMVHAEDLIKKITELATPAPAPHEISIKSNFNGFEFKTGDVCKFINPHIKGRNEEFIILNFYSYYENDFQYVSVYGLSSKEQFNTNIALIKKNEPQDSLKSLLEWIKAQEEFEGRDAIDICDLKEVVSKITQPQESIFDADGWCWDLNKIPRTKHLKMGVFVQSEPVLLFYKGDLFVETVNFTVDGAIAENQNFYKEDCWRPLPTIPTGGNRD